MGLSFLCPLLDYRSSTHITSTHPFLLHPVNLLILPVHSLQQIQKQSTVSWLCSDLALCSLSPFEHITDQPMTDPTVPSWFIDGSTQKHAPFVAGYTIVQGQPDKFIPPRLIISATIPAHTPSQHAELIALTQALTLVKEQKVNIYSDSKYVYNILHTYYNIIICI